MATKTKTETKATASKAAAKPSSKTPPKKEEFKFGGPDVKPMTKEQRKAIIEEALKPTKPVVKSWKYTLDETEYVPKEWMVVLTPDGRIYQEPVPRYWNADVFSYVLASIPDNPVASSRMEFEADIYRTSFEVKDIECNVVTIAYNGTRKENPYSVAFDVKNRTSKIGGNIVFTGNGRGFTKKEVAKVADKVIKVFEGYEEKVDMV